LDNQFTGPIVNLVELTLGTSYDSDGASMTHFLDLLESNINLCHISLLSARPQSDPHRIVHLNSLEILTMDETPTKEVLSHLSCLQPPISPSLISTALRTTTESWSTSFLPR
jgi:hypothetical protein